MRPGERLTLPVGLSWPKTLFQVSLELDAHLQAGRAALSAPIPTRFQELDEILGGGLHPESLTLIGGPPGVGKTIFVVQAARNIAAAGEAIACVVCFEHSEVYLFQRLICLESVFKGDSPVTAKELRAVRSGTEEGGLQAVLERSSSARQAWAGIVCYWERLALVKGHPVKTTLAVLDNYLSFLRASGERAVLFVDYLQKIPIIGLGAELTAERQIRIVTEGLKNLAMEHGVPIVAVAASDSAGLKGGQVRFEDLWGGSSIQYEPDVAILLNRGTDNQVIFSIEKNRLGPTYRSFQLQLNGASFAFLPTRPLKTDMHSLRLRSG